MIRFNNQEFEVQKNMTLAQLIELMKRKQVIENKALLITVNNELVSPTAVYTQMINDGDIIKTRHLPIGG